MHPVGKRPKLQDLVPATGPWPKAARVSRLDYHRRPDSEASARSIAPPLLRVRRDILDGQLTHQSISGCLDLYGGWNDTDRKLPFPTV